LVQHTFWNVKLTNVDWVIEYTCSFIKRTRDVHSILLVGPMDVNKLLKKSLACFCYFCLDSNFQACEKLPWTNKWEVEVLIFDNMAYVHNAMEVAFQVDEWDEYMEMMVITWLPACHWETILQ